MAISETVERATIDELFLDAKNPRLGRHGVGPNATQEEILDVMKEWALEELAVSFLENGFWTQEALVVVEEKVGQDSALVVVEGNRRLAALWMLDKARRGRRVPPKWKAIADSGTPAAYRRLKNIPYVKAGNRKEVQAYLGFRHVSGIKEWQPAEKAEFIAHLIDNEKFTYDEVRRKIGSKTPTVRQNYISYRLLLQMEQREAISIEQVEDRFSVLYLSLRTDGVQTYLDINIEADPRTAKTPVKKSKLRQLENFALWLFGTENRKPIVKDSRDTDNFGTILESKEAIAYLERTKNPTFDVAYRIAGGDEAETVNHVERAADEIEEALATAHRHKKSKKLRAATERVGYDAMQLLELYPKLKAEILAEQ